MNDNLHQYHFIISFATFNTINTITITIAVQIILNN